MKGSSRWIDLTPGGAALVVRAIRLASLALPAQEWTFSGDSRSAVQCPRRTCPRWRGQLKSCLFAHRLLRSRRLVLSHARARKYAPAPCSGAAAVCLLPLLRNDLPLG